MGHCTLASGQPVPFKFAATQPKRRAMCNARVLSSRRLGAAHHILVQRLWKGIRDASKGWIITTEKTVAGLQGLPQPDEFIPEWQRAWDELTDLKLNGEGEDMDTDTIIQRKRPDAWATLGQVLSFHSRVHKA